MAYTVRSVDWKTGNPFAGHELSTGLGNVQMKTFNRWLYTSKSRGLISYVRHSNMFKGRSTATKMKAESKEDDEVSHVAETDIKRPYKESTESKHASLEDVYDPIQSKGMQLEVRVDKSGVKWAHWIDKGMKYRQELDVDNILVGTPQKVGPMSSKKAPRTRSKMKK